MSLIASEVSSDLLSLKYRINPFKGAVGTDTQQHCFLGGFLISAFVEQSEVSTSLSFSRL